MSTSPLSSKHAIQTRRVRVRGTQSGIEEIVIADIPRRAETEMAYIRRAHRVAQLLGLA